MSIVLPAHFNPRSSKYWVEIDPKSAIRCAQCGRVGDYPGWQRKHEPWPPPGWIEVQRTTTDGIRSTSSGWYCSAGCAFEALRYDEQSDRAWWTYPGGEVFAPPDHYCRKHSDYWVFPPRCKVCGEENVFP